MKYKYMFMKSKMCPQKYMYGGGGGGY